MAHTVPVPLTIPLLNEALSLKGVKLRSLRVTKSKGDGGSPRLKHNFNVYSALYTGGSRLHLSQETQCLQSFSVSLPRLMWQAEFLFTVFYTRHSFSTMYSGFCKADFCHLY